MDLDQAPSSDAELVPRIQHGDDSAFRVLFTRYVHSLTEFATAHTNSIDAAEDIVADVFANLWRSRASWNPASVKAYLYSAVRNRALNYLRNQKRTIPLAPDLAIHNIPATVADDLERAEDVRHIERILDEMPLQRRAAAVLKWRDGMSNPEIAEALGISVKAVSMHLVRALKELRTLSSQDR